MSTVSLSPYELTGTFIAHVANLYEDPFAAVASGRKVFEYRERKRPDPVIELLEPGTPILFRECGSERGLLCRCLAPPTREALLRGCRYSIPIVGRRPVLVEPRIKFQGWHRMTAVWVRAGVLRVIPL